MILPQVVPSSRLYGRNFSLTRRPDSQEYLRLLKTMLDRRRAAGRPSQDQ